MLRIHKEGFATLAVVLIALLIINAVLFGVFNLPGWLQILLIITSSAFFLFIVSFFRNPKVTCVALQNEVVSPADGKVVVIEETMETEYFKSPRRQISIFMSPANVHVNRNPISGKVKYVEYHPGKYLVAWHPKSSVENERTSIVIENGQFAILVRQIAGILARRIVYYLKLNEEVKQGEEFGFIKFGSRLDIFLPLNAEITVQLNQNVKGGQTVIARIPAA